jgi:anti-anti-sigma factor
LAVDQESRLTVVVTTDGDGVLIVPQGELDQETVPTFECCLADALETSARIRVDLSQISFIDIAGYRAFMRLGDHCLRNHLVNDWLEPSSSVQLMFRILGPPTGDLPVDAAQEAELPPGFAASPPVAPA